MKLISMNLTSRNHFGEKKIMIDYMTSNKIGIQTVSFTVINVLEVKIGKKEECVGNENAWYGMQPIVFNFKYILHEKNHDSKE